MLLLISVVVDQWRGDCDETYDGVWGRRCKDKGVEVVASRSCSQLWDVSNCAAGLKHPTTESLRHFGLRVSGWQFG